MRTTLLLCCCAIFNTIAAQITVHENFQLINNDVVFTKVYANESTDQKDLRQQILYTLRNYPFVRNVQEFEDGVMTADIIDYRVDYKKFGYAYFTSPNEITDGLWTGKALISFKEGKYKVTVKSLSFVILKPAPCPSTFSGGDLLSVEALTKQRNGFREGIFEVLEHLNKGFSDVFKSTPLSNNEDNW
jgi:hypothetical protein